MNVEQTTHFINHFWDKEILPTLIEYIKIPNKSPHFDPHWQKNGFMDAAMKLIATWCNQHALPNMTLDIIQSEDRTPLLFIDIPGSIPETILMYGHLDKQPEMSGWDEDLGPFKPVLRGDKLYGRGAADDGYAVFASLASIKALQEQKIAHPRCVILIEASEESGSIDLPFYVDALVERIGKPSLVICLDSGCGNYEQMWLTTSLRGLLGGELTIKVLNQGIHSGTGSGVVPSTFRILRELLNRIEDSANGNIILQALEVKIPEDRKNQAVKASEILGDILYTELDFVDETKVESNNYADLILRRTWKPALSITGMDGMPTIENAGNVTLPWLRAKLSIRLPPTCDAEKASVALKNVLEENPPYHASVSFNGDEHSNGWNAPKTADWLHEACNEASLNLYGKEVAYMGEGGSIPFMGMLGKRFPDAQFVITGVLGPKSNAHGPNEFLHIPFAKKLTACIATIVSLVKKKEMGVEFALAENSG